MTNMLAYEIYMKKGQADLRTSIKLLKDEEIDFDIVCFHLQQFLEKYLKAFLLYHNIEPKHTHDISYLISECIKLNSKFHQFEDPTLLQLTDCSVLIRYDEMQDIDKEFILSKMPLLEEFKIVVEELMINN